MGVKSKEKGAELIKRIRRDLGYSFAELAGMMGVSESAVRRWESGERELSEPNRRLLRMIQEAKDS